MYVVVFFFGEGSESSFRCLNQSDFLESGFEGSNMDLISIKDAMIRG